MMIDDDSDNQNDVDSINNDDDYKNEKYVK